MIGEDFGHKYVGHGGWVNGFVSQFTRYPDDDAVIIVLSNFETVTYVQISKDLSAILFGAKVPDADRAKNCAPFAGDPRPLRG